MGNFSGVQYQAALGVRDLSGTDSGIGNTSGSVSDSILEMRLATINDIAFSGGYQASTAVKAGRRGMMNQDYISVYGAGTWTWDFDYLVENQVIAQKLLSLIYPTGGGNTCDVVCTIPTAPISTDVSHNNVGTIDSCADITILAPTYTDATGLQAYDRLMHSALLQSLTITCDVGTDGGRPHMSGQFMSGYKPIISDSGRAIASTVDDWEFSIFDFTTRTIAGVSTATMKSFSMTINNPGTRVGFQGTTAEADGYMRNSPIDITANVVLKLDTSTAAIANTWVTQSAIGNPAGKSTVAIALSNGTSWDISLPSLLITGVSQDQANEGIFMSIDFIATGGDVGSTANRAAIKMT